MLMFTLETEWLTGRNTGYQPKFRDAWILLLKESIIMQIRLNNSKSHIVYIEVICKCCPGINIDIGGGEQWQVECMD